MTDRHAGYVVTLEKNIREDDAQETLAALKQIKGVLDVRPIINGPEVMVAESRIRREMQEKFYGFYVSTFAYEVSKEGSR